MSVIVRQSAAARALSLLRAMASTSGSCPCHAGGAAVCPIHHQQTRTKLAEGRRMSHGSDTDYAFEMAASNIRFGRGVTAEVGLDLVNLGIKSNVLLATDKNIAKTEGWTKAQESLAAAGVKFTTYTDIVVEPTNQSLETLIDFVLSQPDGPFDAFVGFGGGSVLDSVKAANLVATHYQGDYNFQDYKGVLANILRFTNAPIGAGEPVPTNPAVKPFIAIPTTAGTGSETTGTAIFDFKPLGAKTGISSRVLKPLLGIVDPQNMESMPREVAIASGFDVLCHSLESYTAIPYSMRSPCPTNPNLRPAYQGANPISDVWSLHALQVCSEYFVRSVDDPFDTEALDAMALAAAAAGVGFGNAGCHLPHGMSYAISGLNKGWYHPGYDVGKPLVPHGVSVILSAPAVFRFTAPTNPERHMQAAEILGANTQGVPMESAGDMLADRILWFMDRLNIPNGLSAIGYNSDIIPALVEGTLPQKRVNNLAYVAKGAVDAEDLAALFESGMTVY